jgi:hypothetical protein
MVCLKAAFLAQYGVATLAATMSIVVSFFSMPAAVVSLIFLFHAGRARKGTADMRIK